MPRGRILKVLDEKTIAFVDCVGNRQYITLGNLSENPKAHLYHRGRAISNGLLTFQRNRMASETTPIAQVSQSPMAMRPNRMQA
jgi:predicted pyridoxine 5'-phosphate oxidase superfamily flavin-nucleotide-binding protein